MNSAVGGAAGSRENRR